MVARRSYKTRQTLMTHLGYADAVGSNPTRYVHRLYGDCPASCTNCGIGIHEPMFLPFWLLHTAGLEEATVGECSFCFCGFTVRGMKRVHSSGTRSGRYDSEYETPRRRLGIASTEPSDLHSDHDAGVLVPTYQRVVAVLRARLRDVGPARHEVLVGIRARKLARDGCIHGLHNLKVGGEQNVEVALVDLVSLVCTVQKTSSCTRLTNGVETGIIRRLYRVCTTGALMPSTASPSLLKSELTSLWFGNLEAKMWKNCMSRVGMYSAWLRFVLNGTRLFKVCIRRDPCKGWGYDSHAACRRVRNCVATGSRVRE